jgi:transcriptional regulator with XRE-family HTH domain
MKEKEELTNVPETAEEQEEVLVRHRFAQLIKEIGITQAEIARRIGEKPKWVNERLHGVTDIKADDVTRLAAAMRVPPSRFYEGLLPTPPLSGKLPQRGPDFPLTEQPEAVDYEALIRHELAQALGPMPANDEAFIADIDLRIREYLRRLRGEEEAGPSDQGDPSH